MGYWAPPLPSAYDPAPRPLRHHAAIVNGAPVDYPEPEDEEYFGVGLSAVGGSDPMPAMAPLLGSIARLGKPNHVVTFAGWGGNAKTQSPLDRLANYQRLIATKAPEDPEGGGLAADWIGNDGSLHINYFDFSDEHQPRRKAVTFTPKKDGGLDIHVDEYTPENGWQGEGFDFERDFTVALVPIMQALQAVSSAIVTIFASPAAGAAWAAMMQLGVDAAAGRTPPSIEAAIAPFAQYGTAILGPVLASKEGKDVIAGFYKSVQKTVGADFLDKIGNLVDEAGKSFPKVNVAAALVGKIPDELIALDQKVFGQTGPALPNSASDVFVKAAAAFAAWKGGAPKDVVYSIRKTIDIVQQDDGAEFGGKGEFDLAFAALQAADAEIDPRSMVAWDPSSSMTVAQVIALGKQMVAQPGDQGTMTYRQAFAKSGGSLRAEVETAKDTQTAVVGVGLLAILAKLFFF